MIVTSSLIVLFLSKSSLFASKICANKLSVFHNRGFFRSRSFFCEFFEFLFLLNFIKLISCHWFGSIFIKSRLCIRYCLWFPKLYLFLIVIMSCNCAANYLLKLFPIISSAWTTVPSFLPIMEYRFSSMKSKIINTYQQLVSVFSESLKSCPHPFLLHFLTSSILMKLSILSA